MKTLTSLDERRIETIDGKLDTEGCPRLARNPRTAALLSILPGVGQLYIGEKGKGLLFLTVSLANLALILSTIFHVPIIKELCQVTSFLNLKPNWEVSKSLATTPETALVSFIYLGLLLSFVLYAIKDAYNHAVWTRQGTTFPKYFLGLPEATSGSYLFHFAIIASCLVMVLFVIMPPKPPNQVTNIEFIAEPPQPVPARPKPINRDRPKPEPAKEQKSTVHPLQQIPVAVAVPTDNASPLTTNQTEVPAEPPAETGTADGKDAAGSAQGTSSGESQEIDFGPYLAEMQRRIKKAWYPPRGNESKRVTVKFKLNANGEVSAIRLEKSSGISIADDAAMSAVEQAAPFGSLPQGSPAKVDIKFTFDYNVFNGGQNAAQQL